MIPFRCGVLAARRLAARRPAVRDRLRLAVGELPTVVRAAGSGNVAVSWALVVTG